MPTQVSTWLANLILLLLVAYVVLPRRKYCKETEHEWLLEDMEWEQDLWCAKCGTFRKKENHHGNV